MKTSLPRISSIPSSFANTFVALEQRDKPCWQVTRVLGSMLAFDFGHRLSRQTLRGPVEVGSSTLSIRNVFWSAHGVGSDEITSESLDEQSFRLLRESILGAALDSVRRVRNVLDIKFSNGASIALDLTNLWQVEGEDAVAEIALESGWVLMVSKFGRFTVDVVESSRRRTVKAAA